VSIFSGPGERRVRSTPVLLAIAVALTGLGGCAVVKTSSALGAAEVALEGARAAGAEKNAPYEYTAADAHLQKAREESGQARYADAIDHARRAKLLADQAKAKAAAPAAPEAK
jgi:hypothetical protein